MNTGIVLADDHPIFLNGLSALIEAEPDLQVLATVNDGEQAVEAVRKLAPRVFITDISMAGIGGIEAARQVRAAMPDVRILVLSMHAERRHVLAALEAGANGYLLKDAARGELIAAIRAVINERTYLSPAIAGHVVAAYKNGLGAENRRLDALTPREREVLCLIASGQTTKQIAARISVSPKTVATHREHLMRKLEVTSVAGLARYAARKGLVAD